MDVLGVDLAWGGRRPTGLCHVRDGRVVASALAGGDDAVLAWLAPRAAGPCVVAFDAPLVVTNATGRRPCEAAIDRCFRRYEAGCHPTNLGLVRPRAAGLAAALGLDLEPRFAPGAPVRRALEVYPHAALVALFALPRTLKYKRGRGRGLDARRAALTTLADLLRRLAAAEPSLDVTTAPRWEALVAEVAGAPSGAALDRAGDELDAMVCAYVALHRWTLGDRASRVVGDAETGAIVTPVTAELAACLDAAVT